MNTVRSSIFDRQRDNFISKDEQEQFNHLINTIQQTETVEDLFKVKRLGFKQFKGDTKYNVYGIDLNLRSAERIIVSFLHNYPHELIMDFLKSKYIDHNEITMILHRITNHDDQSKYAELIGDKDFDQLGPLLGLDRTLENALDLKETYTVMKGKKSYSILTENKEEIVDNFVLSKKFPMLLEGIAGSGKTEVIKAIINDWSLLYPDSKNLYITASQALVSEVEKRTSFENINTSYMTLTSLLNSMAGTQKSSLNYQSFEVMFNSNYIEDFNLINKVKIIKEEFGLLRIYAEVHGIILGLTDTGHNRNLTKKEYLERSIADSIAKNTSERETLFEIARLYRHFNSQEFFETNTTCAEYLRSGQSVTKYDLVLVDEFQDFTDIQFAFIHSLVKDKKCIFITGDPNQTINPTLFDISNINNLFHSQGLELIRNDKPLVRNYRNSSVITQLINILNTLRNVNLTARKQKYSLDEVGQSPISGKIFLYTGKPEDLSKFRTASNVIEIASDIVSSNQKLKVIDVKGLEFDHVIAYDLISDYAYLLDQIFQTGFNKNKSMHYYFNIFYVAISRTIKNLILVESKESQFLNGLIESLKQYDIIEIVENIEDIDIEVDESIEKIYNNGIKAVLNRNINVAHRAFETVYQINPYYPKIIELFDFTSKAKSNSSDSKLATYLESNGLYNLAELYYQSTNQNEKFALMALYQNNVELFYTRLNTYNIDLIELYDSTYTNEWQKILIDMQIKPMLREIEKIGLKIEQMIENILEG